MFTFYSRYSKMSFCNKEELEECLAHIEERAKPSKNDIRYERYVEYMNCFIGKFGKEQIHLVGSTGERSKLAYSKDDGDADFLMVSGKLEIPVDKLVQNKYAPCYVWIKADKETGFEITQDKYLSTKTLRDVKPELFTILRAICSYVTSKMENMPEAEDDDHENVAVLKISSKVGLQTTTYRNLKFDENIKDIRKRFPNIGGIKSKCIRPERLRDLQIHDHEKKVYRRLYEVAKLAISQSGILDYEGIGFFVQTFQEEMLQDNPRYRQRTPNGKCSNSQSNREDECLLYKNDLDCVDAEKSTDAVFRATFTGTSHKDFVPAVQIKGKLECMKNWKERVEARMWPSEMVNRIYNKQIFVVARISPVNPNPEKDFCLSFNLPEKEMMHSASPAMMKVFLVMKAFLKGVFESFHERKGKELKLKTYHIKHLFFWLYEEVDVREIQSVPSLLEKTLKSLESALLDKKLPHYFVESNNMFVEFEDEDFKILLECVYEVMSRPVESLKFYIQLNNKTLREVWLTEEEMICFLERSDGGRNEYIEKLADAMFDFQRGVNEMRDADGCSPIIAAIVDTFKRCLQDDGSVDFSMIRLLNDVLTSGQTNSTLINERKANKNIEDTVSLIVGISSFDPTLRSHVNQFGGRDGLRHILRGAFCGKRLDINMDIREQIVDAVWRYLSCSDDEEDSLCSELKYKLLCYILFRKEFSDLNGIRQV